MTDPAGRRGQLRDDEEIVEELEQVANLILERPELNHEAAQRLMRIARDIRADIARADKIDHARGRRRARDR